MRRPNRPHRRATGRRSSCDWHRHRSWSRCREKENDGQSSSRPPQRIHGSLNPAWERTGRMRSLPPSGGSEMPYWKQQMNYASFYFSFFAGIVHIQDADADTIRAILADRRLAIWSIGGRAAWKDTFSRTIFLFFPFFFQTCRNLLILHSNPEAGSFLPSRLLAPLCPPSAVRSSMALPFAAAPPPPEL